MTEEQKAKTRAWLQARPNIEDLYEIASLVWEERIRRLREWDKKIVPYSPPITLPYNRK